ncbi:DsbA family protein [Silvibacterium sp.]|uniref:DsbA family protein n=1 Tax=Silvibacterium sp. TaxID=1964179 RepID=UPI0039E2E419
MSSAFRSASRRVSAVILAATLSTATFAFAQDAQPQAAGEPQFPPVVAANFTATSPTKAEVNAFLNVSWGYDKDRVWSIYAIQKTQAPGISRVIVQVAQKSNPKEISTLSFFVTPDGKHLITNDIMPFGAHPYAENRRILTERAAGPSRGANTKTHEIVEFADFQCPHCKAIQPIMEHLVQDYPQVHFVYENYPLTSIHSEAEKAALYSVCVAKQNGDAAFYKFADAVFENQTGLTPESSDATLGDAATKAGLDSAKIGSCAYTAEAKASVQASVTLAHDLQIDETPTVYLDGRPIPVGEVANGQLPYDKLKAIIDFQIQLEP